MQCIDITQRFHILQRLIRTTWDRAFSLRWILFLLFAMSAVDAVSAKTWIVDENGGPGVDFLEIQPAIDAAAPGDLILVRNGTYDAFTVDKGLTVLADTGCGPSIGDKMAIIRGIPQGNTAVLGGFSMKYLDIHDADGTVVVDDCVIGEGKDHAALQITNCGRVVIYRSSAIGRDRPFDMGPSGGGGPYARGAEFENATVILAESYIQGGDGSGMYKSSGTDGKEALAASNCTLFYQASTASGGNGGDAWDIEYDGDGGDGAPGISLSNSYLELFGLSSHTIYGGGGGSPGFMGYYGEPANAIYGEHSEVVYSGVTLYTYGGTPPFGGTGNTVTELSPAVPVITTTGSGQLGSFIELHLHAPAATSYALFLNPFTGVYKVGNLYAHLLLEFGWLFLTGGTIPPGDEEILYFPVPYINGLQGLPLNFQAYMVIAGSGMARISTSAGFVPR